MNRNVEMTEPEHSIVAIAKNDGILRAVELRRQAGAVEVVWAKSSAGEDAKWENFAQSCGLLSGSQDRSKLNGRKTVVAGFESAGVAFYQMDVPAVEDAELGPIVRIQAESRLPLPAEQMELAWRKGRSQNGQLSVTMAAARKDRLQGFVEQVLSLKPAKIMLDCEAVIKVWTKVFGGHEKNAVIISTGEHTTQICLAEDGRLDNAIMLDIGKDEFSGRGGKEGLFEEVSERFVQDVRSVLTLFGCPDASQVAIVVLSDGGKATKKMVASLRASGLDAKIATPQAGVFDSAAGLDDEGVYDYRVPIGLGLVALDGLEGQLDVFERLYSPTAQKEKVRWLYSPRVTGAIAAAMLVLLLAVSYFVDLATPGALERRLKASLSDTDLQQLIEKQKLIKLVAQERPDLLELLKLVNDSGQQGVKLDSFHFKKGQLVIIAGEVQNSDQLYKFQETLLGNKNVKNVEIQNAAPDAKGGKVTFTVNFRYKNFSDKRILR